MFQTKEQLKRRIEELEEQLKSLRHHTLRSALVDSADLPPCKSLACWNCRYITFISHPETGALYLLGCGKELVCHGMEYTEANKPSWQDRKEWLLWRIRAQFPSQSATVDDLCIHDPLPPCHSAQGDKST